MLPERAFRVKFPFVFGVACLWVVGGVGLCGCRTGLQDGVFSKSGVRYEIGSAPPGYTSVTFADNDVAFESKGTGQSMAVNSTCHGYDDVSVPVLMHHLLMGFTEVEEVDRQTVPLDGRDSLQAHVRAKLDGVPVEMKLAVMKKNGCVFDLSYVSPPARYADGVGAFENLLKQFHVEEPG